MRAGILLFCGLLVALFGGINLAHWQQAQQQRIWAQEGVMMFPRPLPISDFRFIDQHGAEVTQQQWQDRWKLMFFGYTFCPDICPTTLADLNRSFKKLPEAVQNQLQVVLVSVDPERDTPESLQPYMEYFNPAFSAMTGNTEALAKLAPELHGFYARAEREDGMAYLMDHSANIVLVSPDWQYHGYIAPPHWPQKMAPLLEALVQRPY